jgi:predicted ArsR family transcriptional regulator
MISLRDRIVAVLQHGPMTQAQLASFLGARKPYVQRLTAEMRMDNVIRYGDVIRPGSGKGGRPQRYFELCA